MQSTIRSAMNGMILRLSTTWYFVFKVHLDGHVSSAHCYPGAAVVVEGYSVAPVRQFDSAAVNILVVAFVEAD
jgi:hypothetical protein